MYNVSAWIWLVLCHSFSLLLLILSTLPSHDYLLSVFHLYFPLFFILASYLFSPTFYYSCSARQVPQVFSETRQKYIRTKPKWVVNIVRELESFQKHDLSLLYIYKPCNYTCNSTLLFSLFLSFLLSFWIPLLSRKLKGFWGNTFPFIIAKTCWETFICKYQKDHTSANKKELHYNVIFQYLHVLFLKELRVLLEEGSKNRETPLILCIPYSYLPLWWEVSQILKEEYYAKNWKVSFF